MAEASSALRDRQAAMEWAGLAARDAKDNPETAIKLARLELSLLHRNLALAALRSGLPFTFQDGQRPVFAEAAAVPETLLGRSLRPIAEGKHVEHWRSFVVAENHTGRMIRTPTKSST